MGIGSIAPQPSTHPLPLPTSHLHLPSLTLHPLPHPIPHPHPPPLIFHPSPPIPHLSPLSLRGWGFTTHHFLPEPSIPSPPQPSPTPPPPSSPFTPQPCFRLVMLYSSLTPYKQQILTLCSTSRIAFCHVKLLIMFNLCFFFRLITSHQVP